MYILLQANSAIASGMKLSVSGMLPEGAVISTEAAPAIQAVSLADGSTAYIQQPKGWLDKEDIEMSTAGLVLLGFQSEEEMCGVCFVLLL